MVCDKWELPLLQGSANALPGTKAKGYYEYANDRPLETGKNALCVEYLLKTLPRGNDIVAEHFGGVGVFATVIQNVLPPQNHFLFEIDDDCLAQLRSAFGHISNVSVNWGDATENIGTIAADIFVMDFPFMTIKRYPEWESQWHAMVDTHPRAILWMDGASRYLHFHKERYSEVFGERVETIEDYTRAMSRFMMRTHGYAITDMAWQHACSYFLAQPGKYEPDNITFKKFSNGSKGLRYL